MMKIWKRWNNMNPNEKCGPKSISKFDFLRVHERENA
jgi:hypothetical protein